jgi:CHAT domain-containing protein
MVDSTKFPSDQANSTSEWTGYGELTPLPDTREEILSIAKVLGANEERDVFLGARANKRQVLSMNLKNRRIVAFATHGLISGDLPGLHQPALALAAIGNQEESPLLTLEDVLNLKLDADWVVLSACNTAAGDGEGAEAVSGLGRGFFYAGSRALLVTHWPVETVSAKLLTTGIFERYAKDSGFSRAQALNASMLAVMANGQRDAAGRMVFSYAHPMFWAPYALVGDGGQ